MITDLIRSFIFPPAFNVISPRRAAQDFAIQELQHLRRHHHFGERTTNCDQQQCWTCQEQGGGHSYFHLCPLDLLYWQVHIYPVLRSAMLSYFELQSGAKH